MTVAELVDRFGIRELTRKLEREYEQRDFYSRREALAVALLLKIVNRKERKNEREDD